MSVGIIDKLSETLKIVTSKELFADRLPVGGSFKETLAEVKAGNRVDDILGSSLQQDLQKLQMDLASGRKLSSSELLLYQIKVGQFGIRVELLSKVAESLLGTVRKFQQGQ